jgi:hypothetical protein
MTAEDVDQVLQRLFTRHGAPVYIKSDNGPECIAQGVTGITPRGFCSPIQRIIGGSCMSTSNIETGRVILGLTAGTDLRLVH